MYWHYGKVKIQDTKKCPLQRGFSIESFIRRFHYITLIDCYDGQELAKDVFSEEPNPYLCVPKEFDWKVNSEERRKEEKKEDKKDEKYKDKDKGEKKASYPLSDLATDVKDQNDIMAGEGSAHARSKGKDKGKKNGKVGIINEEQSLALMSTIGSDLEKTLKAKFGDEKVKSAEPAKLKEETANEDPKKDKDNILSTFLTQSNEKGMI